MLSIIGNVVLIDTESLSEQMLLACAVHNHLEIFGSATVEEVTQIINISSSSFFDPYKAIDFLIDLGAQIKKEHEIIEGEHPAYEGMTVRFSLLENPCAKGGLQ